jgi:hypothetical protein
MKPLCTAVDLVPVLTCFLTRICEPFVWCLLIISLNALTQRVSIFVLLMHICISTVSLFCQVPSYGDAHAIMCVLCDKKYRFYLSVFLNITPSVLCKRCQMQHSHSLLCV